MMAGSNAFRWSAVGFGNFTTRNLSRIGEGSGSSVLAVARKEIRDKSRLTWSAGSG